MSETLAIALIALSSHGYGFGPGAGLYVTTTPPALYLEAQVTSERKTFASGGFTYAGSLGARWKRLIGGVELAGYETNTFGKRELRAFAAFQLHNDFVVFVNSAGGVTLRGTSGPIYATFGGSREGFRVGLGLRKGW